MHVYYCAETIVRKNGDITVNLVALRQAEQRPEHTSKFTRRGDYYYDWFDSEQEALRFVHVQRKISGIGRND